jgi:hypothetical protein
MNGDFHYTYTIALDDDITNEPVSVSVFPVPATDVLNINISGMQHTDVTHAQVFDITGKLVLEKSSSLQIDISNLSKGTFFITIKLSDGSVHNLKFIKI